MVRLSAEEFAARAERGARFVHLVCSPLQRTRESAAPVEELLGLTAQPDERVIEADNYFEGLRERPGAAEESRVTGLSCTTRRPSWVSRT